MQISRRLWLAGAAPLAIAALYGGSVAFADGSPSPANASDTSDVLTQQPSPTTPASPQNPGSPEDGAPGAHEKGDCPGMDGSGGRGTGQGSSGGSTSQQQTRFGSRSRPSSSFY